MNNKSGEYRKQVYDLFTSFTGRNLTEPEHKALKKVMTEYVKSCAPDFTPQAPVEHLFICGKCGGYKKSTGHPKTHGIMRKMKKFNPEKDGAPVPRTNHLLDGEGEENLI